MQASNKMEPIKQKQNSLHLIISLLKTSLQPCLPCFIRRQTDSEIQYDSKSFPPDLTQIILILRKDWTLNLHLNSQEAPDSTSMVTSI